jgi:hypothetical protein
VGHALFGIERVVRSNQGHVRPFIP